jgi:hypothetical protein
MSGPRAFLKHLWIDSDSVITEADAELLRVVPNLDFNLSCARMVEGISQNLTPDPIEFVLKDYPKVSRRPFDGYPNGGAATVGSGYSRKFLPHSRKLLNQAVRCR